MTHAQKKSEQLARLHDRLNDLDAAVWFWKRRRGWGPAWRVARCERLRTLSLRRLAGVLQKQKATIKRQKMKRAKITIEKQEPADEFFGHTPGPWKLMDHMLTMDGKPNPNKARDVCPHCKKPGNEKPLTIAIVAPKAQWGVGFVASVDPVNEHHVHLANAKLIAAGPRLLAEREELKAFLGSIMPLLYERCDKSADCSSQYQEACRLLGGWGVKGGAR